MLAGTYCVLVFTSGDQSKAIACSQRVIDTAAQATSADRLL